MKKVGERVAAEGYTVIAPNLYWRASGKQVVGYDELPAAIGLMTSLKDEQILSDMVGASIGHLQKDGSTRPDRIGVTGFCMGGRVSFLTACNNAAVKAAVPFYGGGIGGLLEQAGGIKAPLLLFWGENDPFIPLDEVKKVEARLTELGKRYESIVYPAAPHGFFCEERDSFRADAAKDAWERLKKFFAANLKG
jgi:carboxymethylenebutenolidase